MTDRAVLGVIADLGAPADLKWRFRAVDRDTIDELPEKLDAAVDLDAPSYPRLGFTSLEDLHPEGIAARVPLLSGLLEARKAAGDEGAVRRLAAEAGAGREIEAVLSETARSAKPPAPSATEEPDAEEAGDLFESILEAGAGETDPIERLIKEAAASAIPADSAAEARHRWAVDRILGWHLRVILRHPLFRRVEAAWRSLRSLVLSTETDAELGIVVLAARESALRAELESAAAGESGRLDSAVEALQEREAGLDALFVDLDLGPGDEDLKALAGLAQIAGRAGCSAVAAARPELAGVSGAADLSDGQTVSRGVESPGSEAWRRFRSSAAGSRVGLCLPRILLRLPYGPKTNVVESFDFDERVGGPESAGYLWGNPALALAQVVAAAVAAEGRGANPGPYAELERLPFHTYDEGDETVSRGPTEVFLPQSSALALRSAGFMPLQGIRGRDAARFLAVQSAAGKALF